MNTEKIESSLSIIRQQMIIIRDEIKFSQMSIDELDLREPTKKILTTSCGFKTVSEVIDQIKNLQKYRGLGVKKVAEIIIALEKVKANLPEIDARIDLVRLLSDKGANLKALGLDWYQLMK